MNSVKQKINEIIDSKEFDQMTVLRIKRVGLDTAPVNERVYKILNDDVLDDDIEIDGLVGTLDQLTSYATEKGYFDLVVVDEISNEKFKIKLK